MKIKREEYQKALKTVMTYRKQIKLDLKEMEETGIVDKNDLLFYSDLSFIACRLIMERFCEGYGYPNFHQRETYKIKELEGLSKKEMMKIRQFGKKSLIEVESLCERADIALKP